MKRKIMLILCGIFVFSSISVGASTVDQVSSISINDVIKTDDVVYVDTETGIEAEAAGEYSAYGTIGETNGITWKYFKDTYTLELSGSDILHGDYKEYFQDSNYCFEPLKSPLKELTMDYVIEKIVIDNLQIQNDCKELVYDLPTVKEVIVSGALPVVYKWEQPILDFSKAQITNSFQLSDNVLKLILPKEGEDYLVYWDDGVMFDEKGQYYYHLSFRNNGGIFTRNCPEGIEILSGTLGSHEQLSWIIDKDEKTLIVSGSDTYDYYWQKEGYYSPFLGICSRNEIEKIVFKNCKMESIDMDKENPEHGLDSLFDGLKNLKSVDLSGLSCSNVKSTYRMFQGCDGLMTIITPHSMSESIIQLPKVFYDANDKEYKSITQNDANILISTSHFHVHDFNGETITKLPNCIAEGEKTRECNGCKVIQKESIPILVDIHDFVEVSKPATLDEDGIKMSSCKLCGKLNYSIVFSKPKRFIVDKLLYDGKIKQPVISVLTEKRENLTDIAKISYPKAIDVGSYEATVSMDTPEYKFTKKVHFEILPPSTRIKAVKKEKQQLTIKWIKKSKMVDGYEVQLSTGKTFKKPIIKKIKKYKTTSVKFKNIKAKKKYYARIRTYKKVSGIIYYSDWYSTSIK